MQDPRHSIPGLISEEIESREMPSRNTLSILALDWFLAFEPEEELNNRATRERLLYFPKSLNFIELWVMDSNQLGQRKEVDRE